MARLCLLDEKGEMMQLWEIGSHAVAVGRDQSADVIISDDTLSRRHFIIAPEGPDFVLKDLGSQNGTWVEGERASTATLHHNDCIIAGRSTFLFTTHLAPRAALDAVELD